MATAFMGYVLPFGQMSFWGATVITNLLSPFPSLIEWVSGGHYVYNPTLKRFFIFHFQFPFLLCGFRILHLFPLHFSKRFLWFHSNSLSISSSSSFRDLFFLTSRYLNTVPFCSFHKHNLRHLPRFPDFFVTFRILSSSCSIKPLSYKDQISTPV